MQSTRPSHETRYDAIVIGAGIGGLGVSALLARAGMRVLTLEREGEVGGRVCSFEYRGHTLNIGGPRAGIEGGQVDRLFSAMTRPCASSPNPPGASAASCSRTRGWSDW